jgi:phosphopantetheinyl transferase (holo-ACP synthase)
MRSKLVCFPLLAMMLLQSVNSGRQDRRKSLERAQQQARSFARLFALKAAFLKQICSIIHYFLIGDEGVNN